MGRPKSQNGCARIAAGSRTRRAPAEPLRDAVQLGGWEGIGERAWAWGGMGEGPAEAGDDGPAEAGDDDGEDAIAG